jgi:hypothetical protein
LITEVVHHCLRFYLDPFICVNMAAFHLHLQSRKQKKVGWVGG